MGYEVCEDVPIHAMGVCSIEFSIGDSARSVDIVEGVEVGGYDDDNIEDGEIFWRFEMDVCRIDF